MSFSKKEDLDESKPRIDRTVQKFLGFSEPSLVTAAVNSSACGHDRKKKTRDKLASLLHESEASRLADKLSETTLDDHKVKEKTKKRRKEESYDNRETKKAKRFEEVVEVQEAIPQPGQLTAIQIKEMMAKAQRMIQERKKAISQLQFGDEGEKQKKIQARLSTSILNSPIFPSLGQTQDPMSPQAKQQQYQKQFQQEQHEYQQSLNSLAAGTKTGALPSKPTPLILDAEGRTVDVSGKEVQLTQRMPTLKANIHAKLRKQFKIHREKVHEDLLQENEYFDNRMAIKAAQRTQRTFSFHEKGKYERLAQRLRTEAQLEKLQQEIAGAVKKTGITSATKLALMAPKKESREDEEISDVEWWDSVISRHETTEDSSKLQHKYEGVTTLIEHPTQMLESTKPEVALPVHLTKKERKKLRRQNRREAWKERQEKIRLGLEPPLPEQPKVRMANLMRILGNEAVQDPTKIEAQVRAQMAKRQKAHQETNAARKLTADQKRERKIRKIKEDTSSLIALHVAVYRVNQDLTRTKKFKVQTNANQLFMTGCVLLYRDCNVVVVEGGPKQQKKFKRLMLTRIRWSEEQIPNKCVLVWEGTTKSRSFGQMKFKVCPTENLAREHFKKVGVEHYWDMAFSGSVLEAAEDDC